MWQITNGASKPQKCIVDERTNKSYYKNKIKIIIIIMKIVILIIIIRLGIRIIRMIIKEKEKIIIFQN